MENELGDEITETAREDIFGQSAGKESRRWHDAILLVYYMDIPQAKAAEMLGMRTQALYTMLHRAKKWIDKKYAA